jgi:hypothetical protein
LIFSANLFIIEVNYQLPIYLKHKIEPMKKFYFDTYFALFCLDYLTAQNLQVHYDLGKDRKFVTTTLEMFKPDKWGSTFFFVDFDYNSNDVEGVSLAYMEIARAIKFWDSPFALTGRI